MSDDIKDDLKEIKQDVALTRVDISEIKTDLRYHIKRTDILENQVKPVTEHVKFVKNLGKFISWSVGIFTALGGLYLAYLAIK